MDGNTEAGDILGAAPAIPVSPLPIEHDHTLTENLISFTLQNLKKLDLNESIPANFMLNALGTQILTSPLTSPSVFPSIVELPESVTRELSSEMDLKRATNKVSTPPEIEATLSDSNVELQADDPSLQDPENALPPVGHFPFSAPSPDERTQHLASNLTDMTLSFDYLQSIINQKMDKDRKRFAEAKYSSRSFSESSLHPGLANLDLSIRSDQNVVVNDCVTQDSDSLGYEDFYPLPNHRLNVAKSPSMDVLPRSHHRLDDEFDLPIENSESDQIGQNKQIKDSSPNGILITPPVSRCNSTAWSDSYNGSDSWEDLRTESQIMNSVNQTIRHELAFVEHMRQPLTVKPLRGDQNPIDKEVKLNESENHVWKILRDKARASLPQSPPGARTIETQYPTNWPPKHGLYFSKRIPPKTLMPMPKNSITSTESHESFDEDLASYMQQVIVYTDIQGPRLIDHPSVELVEGTLLARWCKKDNRTWLWKSCKRKRGAPELQILEPTLKSRVYAKHCKKDNRTWLWKSSSRCNKACGSEGLI